jgi:hypothetical protein
VYTKAAFPHLSFKAERNIELFCRPSTNKFGISLLQNKETMQCTRVLHILRFASKALIVILNLFKVKVYLNEVCVAALVNLQEQR